MNPLSQQGQLLTDLAVLLVILAAGVAGDIRKHLRNRRLDAEAIAAMESGSDEEAVEWPA